jgi:hypothetical protein
MFMKNLVLVSSFLLSASVLATTIYPQVNIWGHGIDVRIYNTTDKDVHCSGTINIRTQRSYKTEFFNETVYRGMTSYRHLPNFNPTDRYLSGFNYIRCYSY